MKVFQRGDAVYVVTPGYLVEEKARLESNECLQVIFDRMEGGLAYAFDNLGSMHEIPASILCGVPEGHIFADPSSTSPYKQCLVCGCQIPVSYVAPLRDGELALLVKEIGHRIREKHYRYFTELFAAIDLSEFESGDAVKLEVWLGLAQAIADVSGYRVSFQAAVLEPPPTGQNQETIVGYQEAASADPTLFVKPAEPGHDC